MRWEIKFPKPRKAQPRPSVCFLLLLSPHDRWTTSQIARGVSVNMVLLNNLVALVTRKQIFRGAMLLACIVLCLTHLCSAQDSNPSETNTDTIIRLSSAELRCGIRCARTGTTSLRRPGRQKSLAPGSQRKVFPGHTSFRTIGAALDWARRKGFDSSAGPRGGLDDLHGILFQ